VQQALIRSRLVRSVLLAAVATGPTGLRAGTRPVAVGVRPTPRPPQQAGGRESGRQVRNQARSRRNHESDPHHDHHRDHRSGITLGWVLAAGRPGSGRPGGRRGRRPAPPGPGSRAAAGGPAGTQSALDAARERRGIGRVAATTAGPRPGAGARTRRRRRRRGRSLARGGCPPRRSGPGCVGGPGPSAVKVAASAAAVRLGLELALKLHQAPDLGAVSTDVRLDVGGQLADGGQVDAEQLRAPL
jgi:hypothetical protein